MHVDQHAVPVARGAAAPPAAPCHTSTPASAATAKTLIKLYQTIFITAIIEECAGKINYPLFSGRPAA